MSFLRLDEGEEGPLAVSVVIVPYPDLRVPGNRHRHTIRLDESQLA